MKSLYLLRNVITGYMILGRAAPEQEACSSKGMQERGEGHIVCLLFMTGRIWFGCVLMSFLSLYTEIFRDSEFKLDKCFYPSCYVGVGSDSVFCTDALQTLHKGFHPLGLLGQQSWHRHGHGDFK